MFFISFFLNFVLFFEKKRIENVEDTAAENVGVFFCSSFSLSCTFTTVSRDVYLVGCILHTVYVCAHQMDDIGISHENYDNQALRIK